MNVFSKLKNNKIFLVIMLFLSLSLLATPVMAKSKRTRGKCPNRHYRNANTKRPKLKLRRHHKGQKKCVRGGCYMDDDLGSDIEMEEEDGGSSIRA